MPQYDWDQFRALLTAADKRRILAMFCFATAPISVRSAKPPHLSQRAGEMKYNLLTSFQCDWEKVATATRSSSVASARNLNDIMIRKLRGAVLKATEGNGEISAAATDETPDTTPITPKIPKTPKKPLKRKTEDEIEDPKPNKFRKLDSSSEFETSMKGGRSNMTIQCSRRSTGI